MESRRYQIIFFTITMLLIFSTSKGQFLVSDGAILSSGNSTLSTNSNLHIGSGNIDLSSLSVNLAGGQQKLFASNPITIKKLRIAGGNNKTIAGIWNITHLITLENGYLIPDKSQNGKIIFRGMDQQPRGSEISFVHGEFYNLSSGLRTYPIGNVSGYHPAYLEHGDNYESEIGMEVLNLTVPLETTGIPFSIIPDIYWKIVATESLNDVKVGMDITGFESYINNKEVYIIEGLEDGSIITPNTGIHINEYLETSASLNRETRILAVATKETNYSRLIIHNLITPNGDGENDFLFIQSVSHYPNNRVLLYDRYGKLIKEWYNFQNEENFDFTSLSTGSYVCLFESTDNQSPKNLRQVVTILK